MRLPPSLLRTGLRAVRPLFTNDLLSMATKRRLVEMIAGASKVPSGVEIETADLAGIPVVQAMPVDARRDTAILFLHGGGYASGSARGYAGLTGALAAAAGVQIVAVDYRLAPEHPFPAALEDALQAYHALRGQVGTVAVAGDSAGGGLTLALAQRVRDSSLPMPVALGLICPWLDLAVDQAARRVPGSDPLIIPALMTQWCAFYAGGHDAHDPGISPIYGGLASLPPIVMHSAADDPLAQDADELERSVTASRGHLIHRRYPNRWHDFHLQVGFLADADDAVALFGRQIAELIARHPLIDEKEIM